MNNNIQNHMGIQNTMTAYR